MNENTTDLKLIDEILNDVLFFYKNHSRENNFNSKEYTFSGLNIQNFMKKLVSNISDSLKKDDPNFFVCAIPTSPNAFTIGCIKIRNQPSMLNGSSYSGFFHDDWIGVQKEILKNNRNLFRNGFKD